MENLDNISFIIPTLNEEKNLPRLLNSIQKTMGEFIYEVLVVDNGSNDKTQNIALTHNTKLLVDQEATIGGLRNIGARSASYDILVFLDADISLEPNWIYKLQEDIKSWPKDDLIITGNSYLVPESSSLVEKHWFSKLVNTNDNYINSGHLITTTTMFKKVNGFNEDLRTGEDYDFCRRAKNKNGVVRKCKNLKGFHHGFPKTIAQFILREAWHGKEDFQSISKLIHSKTALASLANFTLLASAFFLVVAADNRFFAIVPLTLMAILSLATAQIKFGKNTTAKELIPTALFTQFYFFGRVLSPFLKMKRPKARS
ncbi:glycosyltransferase [Marinobacter bryozoorum]|uniref:glycosyltransferase n=1 Tax=Marinobacter bryozoorum TaxID=256324 RepID=UPI002003FE31|nr:glycosyltransferase [Marinobacter bryozoorum]MCK7544039.1 glycosyltransferase [Marinobacter bryozoorum]